MSARVGGSRPLVPARAAAAPAAATACRLPGLPRPRPQWQRQTLLVTNAATSPAIHRITGAGASSEDAVAPPPSATTGNAWRLALATLRPDWPLLLATSVSLAGTILFTLLFPLAIGEVFDVVRAQVGAVPLWCATTFCWTGRVMRMPSCSCMAVSTAPPAPAYNITWHHTTTPCRADWLSPMAHRRPQSSTRLRAWVAQPPAPPRSAPRWPSWPPAWCCLPPAMHWSPTSPPCWASALPTGSRAN